MPQDNLMPRIALGADHAGYHLKEVIKGFLEERGYEVDDAGTWSEDSVDYPDYARKVASEVAEGHAALGILVCGTGIGVAMAANKVQGVRAATAHDPMTARAAREHNNANVLALGGRVVDAQQAVLIVHEFLQAAFAGGRHQRRIDKIMEMDRTRK
jgi:ribose 5-phosphate isomerase B